MRVFIVRGRPTWITSHAQLKCTCTRGRPGTEAIDCVHPLKSRQSLIRTLFESERCLDIVGFHCIRVCTYIYTCTMYIHVRILKCTCICGFHYVMWNRRWMFCTQQSTRLCTTCKYYVHCMYCLHMNYTCMVQHVVCTYTTQQNSLTSSS